MTIKSLASLTPNLIEGLLPRGVATAEAFADSSEASLLPAELHALGAAVETRRREFATGRLCAHRALAALAAPATPILPGADREPLWPQGIVGSITHCEGYRAAAATLATRIAALGIDAEPHAPLPAGVLHEVAAEEETEHLRTLRTTHPGVCWDRLLFSAKEATFKAWFPLTHCWLGFEHAALRIDPDTGTFVAYLLPTAPQTAAPRPPRFHGRWLVARDLVLTAVVVPAAPPPRA